MTADGSGGSAMLSTTRLDQSSRPRFASSVDPWHEPADRYVAPDTMEGETNRGSILVLERNHPGPSRDDPRLDAVRYARGRCRADFPYLKRRGYPISWVELGEEAEGQHMLPKITLRCISNGPARCIASTEALKLEGHP